MRLRIAILPVRLQWHMRTNKQTIIAVTRFASFLSGRFPRGRTVPLVGTPHPPHRDTRAHTHTHTHTHTQTPAQVTVLIPVLGKDVTDMSIVQIHGTGHLQLMAITIIQLRTAAVIAARHHIIIWPNLLLTTTQGRITTPFPHVRLTGPTFVGTPSLPGAFLLPKAAT